MADEVPGFVEMEPSGLFSDDLCRRAVEQFAGLVRAARLHEPGSSAFFDAYVQHKSVGALVQAIGDLTFEELSNLVGLPLSESDLSPVSEAQKQEGPILLEHLSLDVTDVGGILVPRSAITSS